MRIKHDGALARFERERREREFPSDPTAKGKDDNDFTTEIVEYKNSAAGEGGRDV